MPSTSQPQNTSAPVRSMTGFGSASATASSGLRIDVEITTVNRKNLDIVLSAPREWGGLEAKIPHWLDGVFQRGRIQIAIRVEMVGQNGNDPGSRLFPEDRTLLRRELAAFRAFAESEGMPFHADANFLLAIAEKLRADSTLQSWSELADSIEQAVRAAAASTLAMRENEGAGLATVLRTGMENFEKIRSGIENAAALLVPNYRDLLLNRLKKLGLELDVEDERVIKEVAVFADRCDISEELDRLKCHFIQFLELLQTGGPIGRKLDFLCQEIHRECNTITSKANAIEVTRGALEAKNLLERIREQVQNIE